MGAQLATASQTPRPGFARILQPALPADVAGWMITGDKRANVPTETGAAFSAWLPYPEAVAWARELAETYGRPYRVVLA